MRSPQGRGTEAGVGRWSVSHEGWACRWRSWERQLRTFLVWGAFVALALFYLIPVGAVQALVEVDRLRSIPFFNTLVNIQFINAILQSILPSAPALTISFAVHFFSMPGSASLQDKTGPAGARQSSPRISAAMQAV